MAQLPAIRDVMTLMPATIDQRETLLTAQEMMVKQDIRHLPVTDKGKLVGILSDRDLQIGLNVEEHFQGGELLSVNYVCSFNPYCVTPDTPLDEVARYMASHHISSALIMAGDKIEGIFTSTDACRWIGQLEC